MMEAAPPLPNVFVLLDQIPIPLRSGERLASRTSLGELVYLFRKIPIFSASFIQFEIMLTTSTIRAAYKLETVTLSRLPEHHTRDSQQKQPNLTLV
jgi:hypothetical protein